MARTKVSPRNKCCDAAPIALPNDDVAENLAKLGETESLARRPSPPRGERARRRDPNLRALEERLERRLGTRVVFRQGRRKGAGHIAIEYRSLDDLDRLLAFLEGSAKR